MADSESDSVIDTKGGSSVGLSKSNPALSVTDITHEEGYELVTGEDLDGEATSRNRFVSIPAQMPSCETHEELLPKTKRIAVDRPSVEGGGGGLSRGGRSLLWQHPSSGSSLAEGRPTAMAVKASKSRMTLATVGHGAIGDPSRRSESEDYWESSSTGQQRQLQRQRSIRSLGAAAVATEAEAGRSQGHSSASDRPPTSLTALTPPREKIPEGLAQLLRELPEPRELAPLVRYVVISADMSFRRIGQQLKSAINMKRVGAVPSPHVTSSARVQLGRQRRDTGKGPVLYQPTYWLGPKEVPSWRRARALMQDILGEGLKGVRYSSFLAENGSRILAAAIVQRFKKLSFERYRLVAQVRIAQKLNQGMAMFVACLWDHNLDRFALAQFENSTLAAQAILFMVYTD